MKFSRDWNQLRRHSGIAFGAAITVLAGALLLLTDFFEFEPVTHRLEGSTMGTFYTVAYRGEVAPSQLELALENHLATIEGQLSNWDSDSWVSHFNRSEETRPVAIPEHAYQVVRRGLELTRHTSGALDPTLGHLIDLWGFGASEDHAPPDDRTIQSALAAAGPEKLTLEDAPPRIAKAHPALRLNLSSVAKGYAVDILARHLEAEGITNYMVNIGGDIRTRGRPEHQTTWTVAIQKPDPDARGDEVHVTLELNDAGVATSGGYRRFHEIDSQRHPHILDPETGRPVRSNLASATIIASTSTRADGLATACLVLGLEEAQELIARTSDAEGLFIQRVEPDQFRTITSAGWPGSM